MSGKRAKLLRKNKRFSKKTMAMGLGLCVGSLPLAADSDFIISLYPHLSKPLDLGYTNQIQSGVGGGAKFTWRPVDYLNVFAYGDYLSLALQNVDPITLFDGGVGTGYHLGITDNIAMDLNMQVGAYTAKAGSRISGLTGGVSLTFTYRINPSVSADVNLSGNHYASGSRPLMTLNAAASPGLSINLTELFSNKTSIEMNDQELAPVFPVLYSWYENNSFGKVTVSNQEDSSITDVTVSFYQPQYMGHPKECGKIKKLGKGESVDVDLYAFFNEQMLELTEKTDTQASIIVSYSCLGQKRTQKFALSVPVYGRNNMSWDDDRRAAVFVSSKDPAAMLFAKYITSIVRDNVRTGVPVNIQYAMGIFEALDQFGLSYVIDPSSAFADNVGTSSIDFLQFPYQTLMYRGGDCDDLSILVCSLFEAVGIRTAFITVPGHIYMAFDSGLTLDQAKHNLSDLSEMIIDGNEIWVPLEITLSDEGFYKAWKIGAREWNTAQRAGTAALYKMEDSWKLYAPVSVPGASAFFTMPDQAIVSKLFDHSVDQWITKQIEPQIAVYQAKLSVHDDVKTRNSLGILYGKYGLFVQADEQFKKARRQGYVPSILNTGNVYFSMQDYSRARKWYKQVLKEDPDNVLALVGVARCSYELTEYNECDKAYSRVMELDPELGMEYAYLGTFVSSKGRAFSLADRLQKTIWSEETEVVPEAVKAAVESVPEDENVIQDEPISNPDLLDLMDFNIEAYALVSNAETEKEEDEDLEDYDIKTAGDGEPEPETELAEDPETEFASESVKTEEIQTSEEEIDLSIFTESFTGLLSEVALDTNDYIYEELDDIELPSALVPAVPVAPVAAAPAVPAAIVAEKVAEAVVAAPVAEVAAVEVDVAPAAEVAAVAEDAAPAAEPIAVAEDAAPAAEPIAVAEDTAPAAETVAVAENAAPAAESVALAEEPAPVAEPAAVAEEPAPAAEPTAVAEDTAPTAEPAADNTDEDFEIEMPELKIPQAETQIAEEIPEETPVETETLAVAPVPVTPAPAPQSFAPVVVQAIPEVAPMEIPRFTEQPSAQWAPEEAYVAETIPGMKSFEEEMGEYQNEKAFLYDESPLLDIDPDNDVDVPELEQNKEQYANAGVPDVNPFSSYLSAEDAKEVEKITQYTIPETPKAPVESAASVKETSAPVVMPAVVTAPVVTTPVVTTEVTTPADSTTVIAAIEDKAPEAQKIAVAETKKTSEVETAPKTVSMETAVEAAEEKTEETKVKTETKKTTEKTVSNEPAAKESAEKKIVTKKTDTKETVVEKTEEPAVTVRKETASPVINAVASEETAAEKSESLVAETIVEETPALEISDEETKQELKQNKNTEKKIPKGLLALASVALAAGAAGIAAAKKVKNKKDGK